MKAVFLIAVFAVASANARSVTLNAADTSRPYPGDYDCSGKQPGNYIHPTDCTRFITCDAGLQPIERDCGECSNRLEACTPQNRLVYNATQDACLWATETRCEVGGGPVDPPTTESSEESTTTEAADDSTVSPPGETPIAPPQEGDACDPEVCKNIGECQHFLRCDKDSKKLVREECGHELLWNPDNGTIHGGNCDLLDNLSDEVEARYRKDPECLACFWEAKGNCSPNYRYQAPGNRQRTVLELSCSNGLVFSQEKETCQLCQDVTGADGNACCAAGPSK